MSVADAWTDCDVETLTRVVRHGTANRGISSALLEDLRRLLGADQVLLLELDEESARLTAAAPLLSSHRGPSRLAADGWSALLTGRNDTELDAHGDGEAGKRLIVAPLTSPVSEARLVFLRQGRAFEKRDHALFGLIAPHVVSAYRRFVERRSGAASLTPRQRAVLHLVARGCRNDEIAAQLVVSPGTVRKHLDNVFRQLGVSSRAAAVARAFPDGVPPYTPDRPGASVPAQRTG